MLRVGINGFGRIGRAIFRVNQRAPKFEIVAVNDIDPNVENLAYLLRFDSTYGRLDADVRVTGREIQVDGKRVQCFSERRSADVPWERLGIDVLIDATGVQQNVINAKELTASGRVPDVVLTWSPSEGPDHTVVFGVNEHTYDPRSHRVVSASICDVNAAAPVLKLLDDAWGIDGGFITTLHPWLSYQNLLDGSVSSVASPGHKWQDFSLGRASIGSLLPKETTLVAALSRVLPDIASRIDAISFRVPTSIVAASDMTLTLKEPVAIQEVNEMFARAERANDFCGYQVEHLVSIDFLGVSQSFVIDARWTRVNGGRAVKLVAWYDNEIGYSARVVDLVAMVGKSQEVNRRPLERIDAN